MKKSIIKALILISVSFGILSGCDIQTEQTSADNNTDVMEASYTDTVLNKSIPWKMGWLVIGDNGTLLEVQPDGSAFEIDLETTANLNDIYYAGDGETIWIAGDDGTLLKGDADLNFQQIDTGTGEDLTACRKYLDNVYCGGTGGVLWYVDSSGEYKPCNLRFTGEITGMAVSDDCCLFVTDAGEAISTTDGVNWYTLSYGDYYGKDVEFQNIIYDGNTFWVSGKSENGTELFYTSSGTVWGERDINYLDGEAADLSKTQIISMASDGQQIYAWCEDGVMLTIPDCVKCNKKTEIEGVDGGTIGYNGGNLLMISDIEEVEVMETELAKQYQISAETAYSKSQEGAVIIDVRNLEDYEEKHIRGSVLMPLEELSEKLPELYPDIGQTVIFYCTKGVRSQTAVEKAVQMGYVEVYSLGSIDNWIYDFE